MPHGTIAEKPSMSMSTFNATPCSVRRRPSLVALGANADRGDLRRRTVDVGPHAGIAVEAIDPTKPTLGVEVPHRRDDGVLQVG